MFTYISLMWWLSILALSCRCNWPMRGNRSPGDQWWSGGVELRGQAPLRPWVSSLNGPPVQLKHWPRDGTLERDISSHQELERSICRSPGTLFFRNMWVILFHFSLYLRSISWVQGKKIKTGVVYDICLWYLTTSQAEVSVVLQLCLMIYWWV